MMTLSSNIYPQQFFTLESIITALEQGEADKAKILLEKGLNGLEKISSPPERLQSKLFLEALDNILNHNSDTKNLYLLEDAGQQIRMFNFMAEKFPVVSLSQLYANSVFIEKIDSDAPFIFLDIGMGIGQQIDALIKNLYTLNKLPTSFSIIGIEPSKDSLNKAQKSFAQLAEKYSVEILFTGIQKTVEQLVRNDWQQIQENIQAIQGPLFLNASFALHHTQPHQFRIEFFTRLKALNPTAFVIIEPYADFTSNNLMERFNNAWHHYGLTFLAIDTISADEEEKNTVKRVFFGRELPDVLGQGNRIEQYETAEMWIEKLKQSGFVPLKINVPSAVPFNPLIKISEEEHYLGFNVKGHPIVGVICVN